MEVHRHLPSRSQIAALAKIASLALRGRQRDAARRCLLRLHLPTVEGWDAFLEWRQAGRANATAALADFRNSIGTYPPAADLTTVKVPVVCSYGARSLDSMVGLVRSMASRSPATTRKIEGPAMQPFDATTNLAVDRRLIPAAALDMTVCGVPA
jgi:hypothetical protein